MIREGMHYIKAESSLFVCHLCPHNCHLKEGQIGICKVRRIRGGILETINYGEVSSIAIDPIEKKPLYHYKPGSSILSLGSFGCNFKCGFCQNYSISMERPGTQELEAEDLFDIAVREEERGSVGVAFTYNEPSIWYEYIYDFSMVKKKRNREMSIVLVTNGYISKEPLEEILPYVDAMNIDLKSFRQEFYNRVCGGRVEEVMATIERASKDCHVEVTTLVIGNHNSSIEEIDELSSWLASVNRDIPLHLSRYYPQYKFDDPPTPVETILRARETAAKHLNYVYVGNVPGEENNTYCPECGEILITRSGYSMERHIRDNKCPSCRKNISIVL
jgi:pyruvate formate lyase activating enzyme